jgi:hypothetical protein
MNYLFKIKMRRSFLVFTLLLIHYLANAQLDAGTIGSDQEICYGSAPLALTCTATGGASPYNYYWERSNDGGSSWTSISLRTNQAVYSPPILTRTTSFRVRVTDNLAGEDYSNSVTITVLAGLSAGTIGDSQTICYGSSTVELSQKTPADGGTHNYSYQWQSSPDSLSWSNISGAISTSYNPSGLNANTWFRRLVIDAVCGTTGSNKIKIKVNNLAITAQLHDDITIDNNSSTNLHLAISGGTSPYTIYFNQNNVEQSPITNYSSGADIPVGPLATGSYTYSLTSVVSGGCSASNLGTPVTVSVGPTNKALVFINSGSVNYEDFTDYIKPYLENFGIPYDEFDVSSTYSLPHLINYSIIIFGHHGVFEVGDYPISNLEIAINAGVGLYSFDAQLFDLDTEFSNPLGVTNIATSNEIYITNTSHYITQNHNPIPIYDLNSNIISLRSNMTIEQNSELDGATNLAVIDAIPLLQITSYGSGRIVKWNAYTWTKENVLGPVYGMDDLIWRGIVWAARKPFVMQGMPPMVTMRFDDVCGNSFYSGAGAGNIIDDFEWIQICHDYGIIPWCGTFNDWIEVEDIPTLRNLITNGLATASPHAFGGSDFIYFNHTNQAFPTFNAVQNTIDALDFYRQNGLNLSRFFVPHWYEVESSALPIIYNAGGHFLGIHFLPNTNQQQAYPYPPTPWLNCGPYRINRNGSSLEDPSRPVYYGGYVNFNGINFFNCVSEIRDDAGYEWSPQPNVNRAIGNGIRQLRRSFNSMVLATLFSHEFYLNWMGEQDWRDILQTITTSVEGYSPLYNVSLDDAITYIRARNNIRITNVNETQQGIQISYKGINDLNTKCYKFTEGQNGITYEFIDLPQINGNGIVNSSK